MRLLHRSKYENNIPQCGMVLLHVVLLCDFYGAGVAKNGGCSCLSHLSVNTLFQRCSFTATNYWTRSLITKLDGMVDFPDVLLQVIKYF